MKYWGSSKGQHSTVGDRFFRFLFNFFLNFEVQENNKPQDFTVGCRLLRLYINIGLFHGIKESNLKISAYFKYGL